MHKELIIFRHAKSSWNSGVAGDFSRPLNDRGIEAAQLMGKTLREIDCLPECIYLSSSVRTTQTCELFLESAQVTGISLYPNDDLYHASLSTLLRTIHLFGAEYQRVMLLGHNPGLEQLLLHLCPDAPFTEQGKLLTTANIAVIHWGSNDWVDFKNPQLIKLLRPKELA